MEEAKNITRPYVPEIHRYCTADPLLDHLSISSGLSLKIAPLELRAIIQFIN
jgi:hypothetical protein